MNERRPRVRSTVTVRIPVGTGTCVWGTLQVEPTGRYLTAAAAVLATTTQLTTRLAEELDESSVCRCSSQPARRGSTAPWREVGPDADGRHDNGSSSSSSIDRRLVLTPFYLLSHFDAVYMFKYLLGNLRGIQTWAGCSSSQFGYVFGLWVKCGPAGMRAYAGCDKK